jgi:hypothetical protein
MQNGTDMATAEETKSRDTATVTFLASGFTNDISLFNSEADGVRRTGCFVATALPFVESFLKRDRVGATNGHVFEKQLI